MDYNQKIPISQWNDDDRPREKLMLKGKDALSDAELLAILLGSGSRNESAVELAQRILASVGNNLNDFVKLDLNALMKFKGVGEAKAITLLAANELGKRRRSAEVVERKIITCSKDIFEYFQPHLTDLNFEEFHILLLARSNKIIKHIKISSGGITGTVVDTRIILKEAIDNYAVAIVLTHNHPSGSLKPSQADIDITRKIVNAASFFDINVLDHIIIGQSNYYSFADEGVMPSSR